METYAVIRRGQEDAPRVQEIMGLPDDAWSEIKVSFGLDEVAVAEVTFLLTGEQLIALAELAFKRVGSSCVAPEDET